MIPLLWLCFLLSPASSDIKLSDSKLLLPYHSYSPINYTLHGSDGTCYEWYSGAPEVATVTPLASSVQGCSTEAIVTAVWQSPFRATTTVYARVSATGHIVKCDVIVDDIHRIEIETITQELYLHNTPESLVIVGYDEYGNTFSSLHGVPFRWRIHESTHLSTVHGHNVLRFLTWGESEYAIPPSIQDLENSGLQGHMQLVIGLRTGSALVFASLHEPVYSDVPAAHVRLLVTANAQLSPAVAYLIPSSQLKFQVHVVHQDDAQVIQLPSPQYHLYVNDTNLVDLDEEDGCTVTAKQYGQAEIRLLDRNVEQALANLKTLVHSDESHEDPSIPPRRRSPASLIHIVEPAYLRFSLQTSNEHSARCLAIANSKAQTFVSKHIHSPSGHDLHNWMLEVGRQYTIRVDLYDQHGHRLHPSDNIRLNITVSSDKLQLIESTVNFTLVVIQPISSGTASIEAKIIGLVNKPGELIEPTYHVVGSQEMTIYSPIDVQPPFILMPFSVGVTKENTRFQLKATGGDGQYTWLTLNPEGVQDEAKSPSVVITQNGEVSASSLGEAVIVASSTSFPHICGFTKALVTSPASLKFVPGPAEVLALPIDSQDRTIHPLIVAGVNRSILTVDLAVLDKHGRSMSDCRELNITIEPLDTSVIKVLPGRFPAQPGSTHSGLSACLRIHVIGVSPGFTELEALCHLQSVAQVTQDQKTSLKATLDARFHIASYREIDFLNPPSLVAYVALGSTRTFLVDNGPLPWPVTPSGHYARVNFFDPHLPTGSPIPFIKRPPQPLKAYLSAHDVTDPDINLPKTFHPMVFSIQCKGVGTFRFSLEIGNQPSPTNIFPFVMNKDFTLVCQVPSSLQLSLHPPMPGPLSTALACPISNFTVVHPLNQVSVPNSVPFLITLSYFGPTGEKLEAVDSIRSTALVLDHIITNAAETPVPSPLVTDSTPNVFPPDDSIFLLSNHSHVPAVDPYFYVTPSKLGHSTGFIHIHVDWEVYPLYASTPVLDNSGRSSSLLSVFLSPPAFVLPGTHLQLFHLRQAELRLSVLGGSGFFHISNADDTDCGTGGVVEITPVPDGSQPSQSHLPQRDFLMHSMRVGRACLRVIDLCFPAIQSYSTSKIPYLSLELDVIVDVIGLQTLRLHVMNHIELGGQVTAFVEPLDSNGNLMPANFTRLMELHVHQRPMSVSKGGDAAPLVLGVPHTIGPSMGQRHAHHMHDPDLLSFSVSGVSLGSALLSVSTELALFSNPDPLLIQSNSAEIQVFSPVRLSPCNFNLLLGAEYELYVSGGPRSSSMEYTVHTIEASKANLLVERVTTNGVLIRALDAPGSVGIRVRALGHSTGANSSTLLHDYLIQTAASEAYCFINVVIMSAIRIGCPLASLSELPSKSFSYDTATHRDLSNDVRFLVSCDPESHSPSCGTAPLWVEGIANNSQSGNTSNVITPLAMAGVQPALRFKWRLHPPQMLSIAQLSHYLTGFNADVDETASASGMFLFSISPGRVTVFLTVESDQPGTYLVSESGNPTKQLFAQLTVLILPPLRLHSPPFHLPHQLVMSPGAHYQLRPQNNVLANSHVHYRLGGIVNWHGVHTRSVSKELVHPITITSTGLINSLSSYDTSSAEHRYLIDVLSSPNEYPADNNNSSFVQSSMLQLLSIEVIVKRPRFLLVTPISGDYIHASGLPVGGPYSLGVTYHDELGRPFDAVAEEYVHLKAHLHRTDLLDVQPMSAFGLTDSARPNFGLQKYISLLHFVVLPIASPHSRLPGAHPHVLLRLVPEKQIADFGPTYLSVTHGGELTILPSTSLSVAQWIHLPDLVGSWSSSDSDILWIDTIGRFALARRAGQVHLTYALDVKAATNKIDSNSSPTSRLTYTISVTVLPLASICSGGNTAELIYRNTEERGSSNTIHTSAILPIVPSLSGDSSVPSAVRFFIKFCSSHKSAPATVTQEELFPTLTEHSKQVLSSVAPLHCMVRLVTITSSSTDFAFHSRLVPNWLTVLLLWNRNASAEADGNSAPYSLTELLVANLEPVTPHSSLSAEKIQWECVVRTSSTWHRLAPLFGLVLEPGSRIQLQLRAPTTFGGEPDILADAHITPLPGFQLIIPPTVVQDVDHFSNQLLMQPCPVWIHTPNELTRRILIFIPPSTIALMNSKELGSDRLLARSRSPRVLDISSPPRPVTSLTEITQILSEYLQSLLSHPKEANVCSLGTWSMLVKEQVQQIDNNAAVSSTDNTVKRSLLWALEVKASLGPEAVNTIVDVVISLRHTGQHVTVPINIRLPSRGELLQSTGHIASDSFGFTWFHLVCLIIITLLVAVIVHLLFRSATFISSSGGSSVVNHLPPAFSPIGPSGSRSPQLWSQTSHSAPRSFTSSNSPGQLIYSSSMNRSTPRFMPTSVGSEGDVTAEEQKWRRALSGGSPSRLRDTFDSI